MAIAALGMLLLAFLPEGASYGGIAWRMATCGVGYGSFSSPNARVAVSGAAGAGRLGGWSHLHQSTARPDPGAALLAGLLNPGYGSDATPALIAAALALCAGICSVARLAMPGAPTTVAEHQVEPPPALALPEMQAMKSGGASGFISATPLPSPAETGYNPPELFALGVFRATQTAPAPPPRLAAKLAGGCNP